MTIGIRDARVIDPASGLDQVGDLHIEAGKIIAIGAMPAGSNIQKAFDDAGLVAAPGLVDLSVALREPGYGRKGNVKNETRVATAGGTTSLCCPPCTRPMLDTPAVTEPILDRAREADDAKVYPIGALTRGFGDEQLSGLVALRNTGCAAFTNSLYDLTGNRIPRRALEYAAAFDLTVTFTSQDIDLAEDGLAYEGLTASFLGLAGIPETTETVALTRNLPLVEQSGARAHFGQLTSTRDAELVVQTRARDLPMTCDVALYRLVLADKVLVGFSSLYRVQSPLRARAGREALRKAVRNDVVQAIASHHQPRETDAKNAPSAATEPGISGAELLLPLAITSVQDGLLDLPTLLTRLSHGLAQALRLPARCLAVDRTANLVLLDPQGSTLTGES